MLISAPVKQELLGIPNTLLVCEWGSAQEDCARLVGIINTLNALLLCNGQLLQLPYNLLLPTLNLFHPNVITSIIGVLQKLMLCSECLTLINQLRILSINTSPGDTIAALQRHSLQLRQCSSVFPSLRRGQVVCLISNNSIPVTIEQCAIVTKICIGGNHNPPTCILYALQARDINAEEPGAGLHPGISDRLLGNNNQNIVLALHHHSFHYTKTRESFTGPSPIGEHHPKPIWLGESIFGKHNVLSLPFCQEWHLRLDLSEITGSYCCGCVFG